MQQLEKEKIRQQQQQADYDYYYDAGCEAGELRETKVHIPTRCSKVSKVKSQYKVWVRKRNTFKNWQ